MASKIGVSKFTLCFSAYIVASAFFMRQVLNFILSYANREMLSVILWLAAAFIFIFIMFYFIRMRAGKRRLVVLLLALTSCCLYLRSIGIVEERVHIFQFALLGWMASNDFKRFKPVPSLIISLLFCMLVAGIDEAVQHYLPYRYGDMRDVVFAGWGSFFGSILYRIKPQPVREYRRRRNNKHE
jgi:VanZ family protein